MVPRRGIEPSLGIDGIVAAATTTKAVLFLFTGQRIQVFPSLTLSSQLSNRQPYGIHETKTMNKFESKKSQPISEADEGWLVQVYGQNRRLLCVLEPSHGWIFLLGCGVGILLAIIWFNIARYSEPIEPVPPTEIPQIQVD